MSKVKIGKRDKDFILKGKTMYMLFSLSLPLVISNLITVLYDLADGLWLAQLSPTAFTATGFTFPVIFFFISASLGLSIGGTTLISQSLGAKKEEIASKFAMHLLGIGFITGLGFAIIGYFLAGPIINIMGAKGELFQNSKTYLSIMALGFLLDSMIFIFQAILNAEGKTLNTTIIGLTSGILNIILDPFFIFAEIPLIGINGLNMGIAGAAIATILSKFISIIIGFIFIRGKDNQVKINFKNFKYENKYIKRIMKLAIPTAIARSTTALGFTISNIFIIGLGESVVTAFSLVNRINSLFMQISIGIGSSMTAVIGQNFGAKLYDRTKQIVKDGFVLSTLSSILGIVAVYLFQKDLISMFVDPQANPIITDYAVEFSNFSFLNIPSMGFYFIYLAIFQGLGRMKMGLNFSMIRLWLIRIPLLFIFINFTNMEQMGVWVAMIISNIVVLFYGHYHYVTDKLLFPKRIEENDV